MTEYKFHEFADLFPLLEGDEFAELVADIGVNGLRQKIVLFEGRILDGRNRYRACLEAGIEPRFEPYCGSDDKALSFVISANLLRRHLSESQRAINAGKIATLGDGQRQVGKFAYVPTQAKAAEMLNVSERSVRSARAVLDKGTPELVAEVDAGRVRVSSAAAVARLPEAQQREIMAAGPKAVVAAAKQGFATQAAEIAPKLTDEDILEIKGALASLLSVGKRIQNIFVPKLHAAIDAARIVAHEIIARSYPADPDEGEERMLATFRDRNLDEMTDAERRVYNDLQRTAQGLAAFHKQNVERFDRLEKMMTGKIIDHE